MNGKEASKASALQFCRIDDSFDKNLLQRIEEILVEGDSHNAESFSEQSWNWQYKQLPSGEARIYVCLCENEIVGYYHAPIYEGVVDGKKKKFAMVQDVAVSNSMRGRGVFRQLAEFATEDLVTCGVNLIYTFPNQKSIHTFIKYNGYKTVSTYDSYVLPVRSSVVLKSKLNLLGTENLAGWILDKYFDLGKKRLEKEVVVERKTEFDEPIFSLFQKFNSSFFCHLDRTKDYLQWRFFEKSRDRHFLITLEKNSKIQAAGIFKLDKILGAETAVVLDFAFTEESYLIDLLHFIRKNDEKFFGKKIGLIFTACCCNKFLQNKSYGFIKIPPRFNPRPLNLLVNNITEDDKVLNSQNWLALLSDWDVL